MLLKQIFYFLTFSFPKRSRPVLRLQTRLHHSSPTIPLNCTLRSDDAW
jgi:hypothetical protein